MFHIVDRKEGRVTVYVNVDYPTYKKAAREREELLSIYPKGHHWRLRLCIRHPDGKVTNPDHKEA